MAKGDHSRAQNKIDEQQQMSQGYLTGLQSQLGGQYGNFGNMMFGSAPSATRNTFGYGSTVPHYSHTGSPYFSGNGTDTPTMQQIEARLMPALRQAGVSDSASLERALPMIQQMYPGARRDDSKGPLDEIIIPGAGGDYRFDLIRNAETGGPQSLQFMGGLIGDNPQGGGALGQNMADYGNIMSRYQNFADTGGYSKGDLANIRSRALSPIRSAYSNAEREMERGRALQGGYSPGMNTARARMAREQGQLASDTAGNTEAQIAQMVHGGKLAGLSGMSGMYGTTPGISNMIGQQMMASMAQQLQAAGLQNQLGLGIMGRLNESSQIPGNFQSAMGNIGSMGQAAGQVGGAIFPWVYPSA